MKKGGSYSKIIQVATRKQILKDRKNSKNNIRFLYKVQKCNEKWRKTAKKPVKVVKFVMQPEK